MFSTNPEIQNAYYLRRVLEQHPDPVENVPRYLFAMPGTEVSLLKECVGALAVEVDVDGPGAVKELEALLALTRKPSAHIPNNGKNNYEVFQRVADDIAEALVPAKVNGLEEQAVFHTRHLYASSAAEGVLYRLGNMLVGRAFDTVRSIVANGARDLLEVLSKIDELGSFMDDSLPRVRVRRDTITELGALVAKSSSKAAKAFYAEMIRRKAFCVMAAKDFGTGEVYIFPTDPFFCNV
jgi:hypothetical protein